MRNTLLRTYQSYIVTIILLLLLKLIYCINRDYHNDAAVRVEAIVLLYKIINNPDLNYAAEIMPLMVDMLEKHKERRYFKDSQLHKLKYRLMQSLLILEPVLNEVREYSVFCLIVKQNFQDLIS